MKVIKSESAPNCRPGEIWQKPTGEYRKFTGGGWVAPSESELAEIRKEAADEDEADLLELTDEDSDARAAQAQEDAERLQSLGERLGRVGFKVSSAVFATQEISVESLDGRVGEKVVGLDAFEEFVNQLEIRAAAKPLSAEDIAKLQEARKDDPVLQEKKDQSSGAGGHDANGSPVE